MNTETKSFVCIRCPIGCTLTVTKSDGGVAVSGNTCKRGEEYGIAEVTAPTRIVTTTVRLLDGEIACAPVRTAAPVPKDKIFAVLFAIKKTILTAPVRIGDVAVADVCGTGVDVIVTRNIDEFMEDMMTEEEK